MKSPNDVVLDAKLRKKYLELRQKYPEEEYKIFFAEIPGLGDLDEEIAKLEEAQKAQKINDLKGEYWNLTSFVFHKLKDTSIYRKWCKEQFDCQFGVCAICGKPISNIHNARGEHIKSRREFGTNYTPNLCLVHKNCKRKGNQTLEVDTSKYKENRFSERLNEYVADLTADTRKDYPVEFPDEMFETIEDVM